MRLLALFCAFFVMISCVGGERVESEGMLSMPGGQSFAREDFREHIEKLLQTDLHANTPHKDYLIHVSELTVGEKWDFMVAILDKNSDDRGEILVKEGSLTMFVKDLDRSGAVKAELLDATAYIYEALMPFSFAVKAPSVPL